MKLISWNINGIRAWHKKGNFEWFKQEKPDIFCVQETKAETSQIPEEMANLEGYSGYFASSKLRKGYSGVAILTKIKPEKVEYGLGIKEFDDEGRLIILYFKDFVLFNCYFPNGGQGEHRIDYKLRFYDAFLKKCETLKKQGKSVIFCGDVNTAHNEIDLARPKENQKNTGFLPIERAWIDKVVEKGFIDTFRYKNTDTVKYSYWDMKTFARQRNVGWRIDYFFVSDNLKDKIRDADILDSIYGSDHCPILLDLNL